MNPRLYQAMDLLYMPQQELQLHLKEELLVNPFLELVEPEDPAPEEMAAEAEQAKAEANEATDEVNWEDILLDGFQVGTNRGQFEEREFFERVPVEQHNLVDHLRDQLQLLDL